MKKVKLLSVLLCASAITLAGCNGGGDTSSAPEGSTSAPSTSEPSTSVEPVVTDWSEEIKADMRELLNGTVLPYVSGTWKASKDGTRLVLQSRDVEVPSVKDVFVAANYKAEFENVEQGFYAFSTRATTGTVTVVAEKTTGSYKSKITAYFEVEPEHYWGFVAKQLMLGICGDYLPYVDGTWEASVSQLGTSVMLIASDVSVAQVAEAFAAEDYLMADDPAPYTEGDQIFTSFAPTSEDYYATGWIFKPTSQDVTIIQAYAAPSDSAQVTRYVAGEVAGSKFGAHTHDTVTVNVEYGNYYSAGDFTADCFSVSPEGAVGEPVITPTESGFAVSCEVLAEVDPETKEPVEVTLSIDVEKGKVKAYAEVSFNVVSDDVKLDWLQAEKDLMNTELGFEVPFFGPSWTVTKPEEALVIASTEADVKVDALEALGEAGFFDFSTEEETVYGKAVAAGIYMMSVVEEEGSTSLAIELAPNKSVWSDEDLALMHTYLGEGIEAPCIEGYFDAWDVYYGQPYTTYYNVPSATIANTLVASYDFEITTSAGDDYMLKKALTDTDTLVVLLSTWDDGSVDYTVYVESLTPYDEFPVDAATEFIRNFLQDDTFEPNIISTIEAVPEDVTYTFYFAADGRILVKFSRDLTMDELTAISAAYCNLLAAEGSGYDYLGSYGGVEYYVFLKDAIEEYVCAVFFSAYDTMVIGFSEY